MSQLALEIKGVRKRYPNGVEALKGVDLHVPEGVIFGLVGPNGAGKTTLFSILCGFLSADVGTISMSGNEVRQGVAPPPNLFSILPQDAKFMPGITVRKHLLYYAALGGIEGAGAEQEVRRVLEIVGLPEVGSRTADTLSHGMHKRIGIAQAFLGAPRLVILDEPTAGLDPHAAGEVRALLGKIRGSQTVVISSHNLLEIEDICTEVAILHKGKMVRQDSIATLLGEAAEVSFRMSNPPPQDVQEALKNLVYIRGCSWDGTTSRFHVNFDPNQKSAEQASQELVTFLVGRGVQFLEMQIGKRLEDRFLEETGK